MNREKLDFVFNFDPYDAEHVEHFMTYKQFGYLPTNHIFESPRGKYESITAIISNKIVHSWNEQLNKHNNRHGNRHANRHDGHPNTPRVIHEKKERMCIPFVNGKHQCCIQ